MKQPVVIDYYSDLLCVWAWIAQKRIDELNNTLGEKIAIHYHYMDIFGDTQTKMEKQWGNRGGYEGFAKHVIESAKPYPDAVVSQSLWSSVKPTTSTNAHLLLKAIELQHDMNTSAEMALVFRKAFFIEAQDISDMKVLYSLIEQNQLDVVAINELITNGKAIAALMTDYQLAKQHAMKGSPTYIIDNHRQTLYGNVGYRVLLANIEEQLKHPNNEASWC